MREGLTTLGCTHISSLSLSRTQTYTHANTHTLTRRDQTHFRYRRHVSAVQLALRSWDSFSPPPLQKWVPVQLVAEASQQYFLGSGSD